MGGKSGKESRVTRWKPKEGKISIKLAGAPDTYMFARKLSWLALPALRSPDTALKLRHISIPA